MNGSQMVRVVLMGLALVACGGRVEEEGQQGGDEDGLPSTPQDKKGEQGGSGSGSGGSSGGGSKGGVLCPVAPARPDYAYCYDGFSSPCLSVNDPELPALLGNAPPVTSGPWEGSDEQCHRLCCYAP